MRIGIISDTHDNIWRLEDALIHLEDTEVILHCGNRPVHMVWGNNDGDRRMVSKVADDYSNITIHGDFVELELDGSRIAVNHYPEIGQALVHSGRYDLVCYGHDHTAHQQQVGNSLLINPGEVMGMNGRATLSVYDTETRQAELIEFWKA
jgi:putative phosphoesterase